MKKICFSGASSTHFFFLRNGLYKKKEQKEHTSVLIAFSLVSFCCEFDGRFKQNWMRLEALFWQRLNLNFIALDALKYTEYAERREDV